MYLRDLMRQFYVSQGYDEAAKIADCTVSPKIFPHVALPTFNPLETVTCYKTKQKVLLANITDNH